MQTNDAELARSRHTPSSSPPAPNPWEPHNKSKTFVVRPLLLTDIKPAQCGYPARSISLISATEAFNTGLELRDRNKCVICGYSLPGCVSHCHIIPKKGTGSAEMWRRLKSRGFIPAKAKSHAHEARNGLMLCLNHHKGFNELHFFLRFVQTRNQYVLVNISGHRDLKPYHDKPLSIDPDDPRAPFPVLFIVHEQRAWGVNPLARKMKLTDSMSEDEEETESEPSTGTEPATATATDDTDDDNDDGDYGAEAEPGSACGPNDFNSGRDSSEEGSACGESDGYTNSDHSGNDDDDGQDIYCYAGATRVQITIPDVTGATPSNVCPPTSPKLKDPSYNPNRTLSFSNPANSTKPCYLMQQVKITPNECRSIEFWQKFTRENMINMGFKNWTACEREGSEDEPEAIYNDANCKAIHGRCRGDILAWLGSVGGGEMRDKGYRIYGVEGKKKLSKQA